MVHASRSCDRAIEDAVLNEAAPLIKDGIVFYCHDCVQLFQFIVSFQNVECTGNGGSSETKTHINPEADNIPTFSEKPYMLHEVA